MTFNLHCAAEANLVVHMSWVQARLAGMRVIADERLTIIDSGLPCDTFNYICRARLAPDDTALRIAAALAYFCDVRRPFSWWVGPTDQPADLGAYLLAASLESAETELGMAADLAALAQIDLAPYGLRIERARTEEQLREFATLNAENWTPPDVNVLEFYRRAAALVLSPDAPLWLYVGYLDGRPVATAEATIAAGVAGLYNISTRAEYRRRGIGSAMTTRPLLDARAAGVRTGVLQAAAEGVSIYTRVGFRKVSRFTEYKPAASSPSA